MSKQHTELDRWFNANASKIRGICAAALSRRPVAHLEPDDVVSVVYVKALSKGHLNGFLGSDTAFARVKVMARSAVTDARRRVRATHPLDEAVGAPWGGPSPLDALLLSEQAGRVHAALGRLTDRQRATIVEVDFEGKSYAEIAAETGSPISTIGCRLHRARQAFAAQYTAISA